MVREALKTRKYGTVKNEIRQAKRFYNRMPRTRRHQFQIV